MEKNEEYFAGAANIDTIVFKIVTDDNAKAMQLLSGELDLAQITPKEESLFTDNDKFKVYDMTTSDYRGILYNFNNEYWQENADLIPAINYAIDRQAIADLLVYADPATGLIANTVFNATEGKTFRKVQGDVLKTTADADGARALLAEAGVSGGSFTLGYRQNECETAVAEYVKGVWESLGFKVELRPLTAIRETVVENSEEVDYLIDSVEEAYETGDFDVLAIDVSMQSTDAFPALAVYALTFSGSGIDMTSANYDYLPHVTGFNDEVYNEIIERAYAEKNIKARADILAEAERYLLEQMPVMPIVFNKDCYLAKKTLTGLGTSYLGYRDFSDAGYKGYKFVPETDDAAATSADGN